MRYLLFLLLFLPQDDWQSLHKELVPSAKEKWREIPWKTDLLAARDDAVKRKRPLFMWAMNGHPLGCT